MFFRRLHALPVLISVCAATLAAQSLPNKTPNTSQIRIDGVAPALDSRGNVPPLFSKGEAGLIESQSPGPFHLNHGLPRNLGALASNDTCYSIRSYGFVRDNPESDVTRLSSYSTCQTSIQNDLKLVADPHVTIPH